MAARTNRNSIPTMFNQKAKKDGEILFTGLHITTEHTGKMEGMYSLSTTAKLNPWCELKAQNIHLICHYCYAEKMLGQYKDLEKNLESNTEILTSTVLSKELLPIINAHSFRFEAFGDLINTTQVKNYFNICRKNKEVHFTIWTKNAWIIRQALEEGEKKPRNLIIIFSSPIVNKAFDLAKIQKVWPFVDKVFTVYDSEEAAEKAGVQINCGGRKCITCLNCYRKGGQNVINELKK